MTFEEWVNGEFYCWGVDEKEMMAKAWEAAQKAARPEWIPVDERLPTKEDINEFGMILACFPGGVIDAVGYGIGDSMGAITHWMPLPIPPDVSRSVTNDTENDNQVIDG